MTIYKKPRTKKIVYSPLTENMKFLIQNNKGTLLDLDMQTKISCIMYAITLDKVKIIEQYITSVTLKNIQNELLVQSIYHNATETFEYLLENRYYNKTTIEKAIVVSIKKNRIDFLEKLIKTSNTMVENNINLNKPILMRFAIRKRNLEAILILHQNGFEIFPPISNKYQANQHLFTLIERNDEKWIEFYIKNDMVKAIHFLSYGKEKNNSLFLIMLILNEKYNGFAHARKIIDTFLKKESGIKEAKELHASINYIFPSGTEEKIAPIREEIRNAINNEVALRRVEKLENSLSIKRQNKEIRKKI